MIEFLPKEMGLALARCIHSVALQPFVEEWEAETYLRTVMRHVDDENDDFTLLETVKDLKTSTARAWLVV